MKTLLSSAFALVISANAFCQDTLFTRNGEVIPAKVHEISATEIKYKKPSNPDGPLYVISKDEIAVIEYKNGSKDVFPYSGGQQPAAAAPADPSANQGSSNAQQPSTQVNNNYYGNPNRPGVNVVLGMGGFWGVPYWGGGWGWYRPYYRPYYNYGWGRGWNHGYGGGWHGGGWHGGGYGHHHR